MRAISGPIGRTGQALVIVGVTVLLVSTLVAVLKATDPLLELSDNALIHHREGLIVVAIAVSSLLMLDLWATGWMSRALWAIALGGVGLGSGVYASSLNETDVVEPVGSVWSPVYNAPIRIPAETEPGLALGITAAGGMFVALGALFLLAGTARRTALQRPERTHPVWM